MWFGDGRYVLWSDIPNDRIMRWDEETGAVSRLPQAVELLERQHARSPGPARHLRARQPARDPHRVRRHRHGADGLVRAASGSTRRTTWWSSRTTACGSPIRPSACSATTRATPRRSSCPPTSTASIRRTGKATVATGDIPRPNGLCFSPDESRLYVVVGGAMPREIRVFDVVAGGTALANGRVFINTGAGIPDGLRCDTDGNLWCGWGGGEGLDGVAIFNPDAQADRPHPAAGALRQPLLRRGQAQPALPRREPVALLDLRQYPGRGRRLSGRRWPSPPACGRSATPTSGGSSRRSSWPRSAPGCRRWPSPGWCSSSPTRRCCWA